MKSLMLVGTYDTFINDEDNENFILKNWNDNF